MTRHEVADLIKSLCDATVDAVDFYVSSTGEDMEQMPERVMQVGAAFGLVRIGKSAVLEVGSETINRRLGSFEDLVVRTKVESIINKFRTKKIDMIITATVGSASLRKPIGYVEFKKWEYEQEDISRVSELSILPEAAFGCCVFLRNSPADDGWVKSRSQAVKNSIVFAKDTIGKNEKNHPCCVVCVAQPAPGVV